MPKAFVACLSKLGSYKTKGPETGEILTISSSGTWIDAGDAAALVKITITVCCTKGGNSKVHPVFYARPTADQMLKGV